MFVDCDRHGVVFRSWIIRINISYRSSDNYVSRYSVPCYAAWRVYSGRSGRWSPPVYDQMFNNPVNSRKMLDTQLSSYGICLRCRR